MQPNSVICTGCEHAVPYVSPVGEDMTVCIVLAFMSIEQGKAVDDVMEFCPRFMEHVVLNQDKQ